MRESNKLVVRRRSRKYSVCYLDWNAVCKKEKWTSKLTFRRSGWRATNVTWVRNSSSCDKNCPHREDKSTLAHGDATANVRVQSDGELFQRDLLRFVPVNILACLRFVPIINSPVCTVGCINSFISWSSFMRVT